MLPSDKVVTSELAKLRLDQLIGSFKRLLDPVLRGELAYPAAVMILRPESLQSMVNADTLNKNRVTHPSGFWEVQIEHLECAYFLPCSNAFPIDYGHFLVASNPPCALFAHP